MDGTGSLFNKKGHVSVNWGEAPGLVPCSFPPRPGRAAVAQRRQITPPRTARRRRQDLALGCGPAPCNLYEVNQTVAAWSRRPEPALARRFQ